MMLQAWGYKQPLAALCLLACFSAAASLDAKPLCRDAMFHCRVGDSFTGTNLRRLVANRKSLRWVKRYCSLTPASLEPAGCDWKRSVKRRQLGQAKPERPAPRAESPKRSAERAGAAWIPKSARATAARRAAIRASKAA